MIKKKKRKKKCPNCNSQRTTEDNISFKCQKCDYINLK